MMQKGQIVIINECHKIPELVGKTAEVVATNGLELGYSYPIRVMVDGYEGPIGFREDELIAIG